MSVFCTDSLSTVVGEAVWGSVPLVVILRRRLWRLLFGESGAPFPVAIQWSLITFSSDASRNSWGYMHLTIYDVLTRCLLEHSVSIPNSSFARNLAYHASRNLKIWQAFLLMTTDACQ